jgi:single-stranded DNA-binding protein
MITSTLLGKLHDLPQKKQTQGGKAYATAKVRTPAHDGSSMFVNLITFDKPCISQLLALDKGDAVALTGELMPKLWTDKEGNPRIALDMQASNITTPYHHARKRKAMQQAPRLDFESAELDF